MQYPAPNVTHENLEKLEALSDPEYRKEFSHANLVQGMAYQIRVMRTQRGWTQKELANKLGLRSQSSVARLEDPSYGKFSLSKLVEISNVFDVALLTKFVSFGRLIEETEDLSPAALNAESFESEYPYLKLKYETYQEAYIHSGLAQIESTSPNDYITAAVGSSVIFDTMINVRGEPEHV